MLRAARRQFHADGGWRRIRHRTMRRSTPAISCSGWTRSSPSNRRARSCRRPTCRRRPSEQVHGFEDMRLFAWRDELWCIACVRELTPEGWCDQVLARIDDSSPGQCRLTDWRVLRPEGPRRHEKNWMPRGRRRCAAVHLSVRSDPRWWTKARAPSPRPRPRSRPRNFRGGIAGDRFRRRLARLDP